MRTRPLNIDEIAPQEEFSLSLQHVLKIDCVLSADWGYITQILNAIYTASCSARIVIHLPDVALDDTLHPDNRIWLLEKYLIQHSQRMVWQRYQMLRALERIELRFATKSTLATLGNTFGHFSTADGNQSVFTSVKAPGSSRYVLWHDDNAQRIAWSVREFGAVWHDQQTMPCPNDMVDRLLAAHSQQRYAPLAAATVPWLVPADTSFVTTLMQHDMRPVRLIHRCHFAEQRMVRMLYTALAYAGQGPTVAMLVSTQRLAHYEALIAQMRHTDTAKLAIYAIDDAPPVRMTAAAVWLCEAEVCTDVVMRHPTLQQSLHQSAHVVIFGMMAELNTIPRIWQYLLYLSVGCDSVLGNTQSRWRRSATVDKVGHGDFLAELDHGEIWEWMRNPLPSAIAHPWFAEIRTNLRIGRNQDIAHRMAWHTQLSLRNQEHLLQLTNEFCLRMTPWSRCVIDDTLATHESFLQQITIHDTAWQYASPQVVQRIVAILRMRKHCLFWVDQSIDTLALRDACQRLEQVTVVYIGESDCTVNGSPSVLSMIPTLLSQQTVLVLVTHAAAARIWEILPMIDITIDVAPHVPPLTSHLKRWIVGRCEEWFWDAQLDSLAQRVRQPVPQMPLSGLHIPQVDAEPSYVWHSES